MMTLAIFKRKLRPVYLLALLIFFSCKGPSSITTVPGTDASEIDGAWELVSLSGESSDTFRQLYPVKKPFIKLSFADNRITGHTGCNSFSGGFTHKEGQLDFTGPFASTKMACGTEGEKVFFETLKQAAAYRLLKGKKMELLAGEQVLMLFRQQP